MSAGDDDSDDERLIELEADEPGAILRVSASEHDLIVMARALVAPDQHDLWGLLANVRTMPPHIGPTCADLIGEALTQVWPALWRRDAARPGTSIQGDRAATGRGWERHPPARLDYTTATLNLLRWLVAMPLGSGGTIDPLAAQPLAVGDQVAIYLALHAVAGTPSQTVIARQPMTVHAPLAWLGFAHLMKGTPPAFDSLVTGSGAIVVEALSRELAAGWRAIELTKQGTTDPELLLALGSAQDAALGGFMAACDQHRRRDLAGFVIDAALPLLARNLAPIPKELDPAHPLSTRAAARLAAGSLLRGVDRWRQWDELHRAIRFIDEGYASAQLLLTRFERLGRTGVDRTAAWLAELASLTPGPTSATVDRP